MGRYLLLWMLGIPLPILVLIYAFGGCTSLEFKTAATKKAARRAAFFNSRRQSRSPAIAADNRAHGVVGAKVIGAVDIE